MGVCQSVGGAATSGQGLTGGQIAAALVTAATAQLQSHQAHLNADRSEGTEFQNPPLNDIRENIKSIIPEMYAEERVLPVKISDDEMCIGDMTVYEYAPEVFRFLRQLEGIEEDVFVNEWTLPKERLRLELGDGRSMALFLKSNSTNLMCKVIAKTEADVLLELLENYTDYLVRNAQTVLMRFLMLLRVEACESVGYIVCFADIFARCSKLHEKWDLKGRVPKPGKYQHFPKLIPHHYEPLPSSLEVPHAANEVDRFGQQLRGSCAVSDSTNKCRLVTRKDKDLTRLFWVEHHRRHELLQTLMRDYKFLCSMGLMDYSLLVGVSYNDTELQGFRKPIRGMRMTYPFGSECGTSLMEVRLQPQWRLEDDPQDFANGIGSLYDQEVYYIGIIDILTKYSWKKKTAHFCKSFLWKDETLSTIPPRLYCDRLIGYTCSLFPELSTAKTHAQS